MTWTRIRLELARTSDHPQGSASIAYLVDLPLRDDGRIDEAAIDEAPERARVLRSDPDGPDHDGYLIRTPDGWAFSYEPGDGDDEGIFHLERRTIVPGEYLTLSEPEGEQRPFRVATLHPLD